MRSARALGLALVLGASGWLAAAGPGAPDEVVRCDTAAAQLELARARRGAMRGLEGEAREAARAAAVAGYRAVREHFPDAPRVAAEASFRAGELLRAAGRAPEALAEFEHARRLGAGGEFRARGQLEIGHVLRRAGRPRGALDAYLAVQADASARRRHRDEAGLWSGRAWDELGLEREARAAWRRVAAAAEDPLDRVRAYDLLAAQCVERGDLEGAAGVLHRARLALADVALEESSLGARVRRALESMRALDSLRDAVDARARDRGARAG